MKDHPIKQEIFAADKAINNKDFDNIPNFYTEDAALVVKPGLVASGRTAIAEAHKEISKYFNGSLEVSQGDVQIIEAGNVALVHAKTFVKSQLKLDSKFSTERESVYVYVRDSDGKWRCAIDNSYGAELLQAK
ncbi:YybH family protein [Aliikangiella coralliicola]|uniref:SgcJ/EcaC family oxidoreductase n=1 Tax=Aliikangiella coralliicola TaxID=2592383 RepID=A0A545UFL1_9GAMM|nr:SgcJ/EcaC family oxidoreductase [Aliikangiella coralliicola]TQV88235.1 SgcJ/EcaC family oxidoreductase [Aliikangiella coralliicola]